MRMTQEEINKAVDSVMELRPEPQKRHEATRDPSLLKRMDDLQFQREMEAIMLDENLHTSAFFFTNTDASKGGKKNLTFNPYMGLDKK
ncbi:hypothetical protein KW438_20910 [Vibrio fluvialis]|nr:hypothetical protein [Vibrio fluvialis]